jgi:hypothetical protein
VNNLYFHGHRIPGQLEHTGKSILHRLRGNYHARC